MTNALVVNDLTARVPLPWVPTDRLHGDGLERGRADASAAAFDVAVPSGNFGAEPQRLDATKARIAVRVIERYVDRQKEEELAAVTYHGARQDIEPVSGAPGNQKRNRYWSAPVVRPVNWTRANTFSALQEWEGV